MCNEKERDGQIYALFLKGDTFEQLKSKFNIPVKELRWIVRLEAIKYIERTYPDINIDEAIRRAIAVSYE